MTKFKQVMYLSVFLIMSLALSVNAVMAQEETEAVQATSSSLGLTIALFGLGALVIFGLGFAMNAQQADENNQA
ncbi:MAG: hypothetical protein Phog2KO_15190 [Phototrophicaceae bacterium]